MTAPVVPRKEAIAIADSWRVTSRLANNERDEMAADVEEALRAAEAAERERCAKVVERVAAEQRSMALEKWEDAPASAMSHDEAASAGPRYAAAIRAMGQEEMGDGSPDVLRSAPDGAVSRCGGSPGKPGTVIVTGLHPLRPSTCYGVFRVDCPGCPACRKEGE